MNLRRPKFEYTQLYQSILIVDDDEVDFKLIRLHLSACIEISAEQCIWGRTVKEGIMKAGAMAAANKPVGAVFMDIHRTDGEVSTAKRDAAELHAALPDAKIWVVSGIEPRAPMGWPEWMKFEIKGNIGPGLLGFKLTAPPAPELENGFA